VTCELDLLTVNLWGLPWPFSRDRRARERRFAEHLSGGAYDLVGVQELWWPWRRALARGPLVIPSSPRDAGLALAGRLPIREARVEHFRDHCGIDRLKRKGVLYARADAPRGAVLAVAVLHLQAGRRHASVRARQLDELLCGLGSETGPVVLLGDFNFYADVVEDQRSADRLVAAGFCDAAHVVDRPEPTFVASNPYVRRSEAGERFDRVYLRDGSDLRLRPVATEVVHAPSPLSDHHPLRVRVRLTG